MNGQIMISSNTIQNEKPFSPSPRFGERGASNLRGSRRRGPKRDGYVLVLVVMLLFGIFAMAALVIDIGFARHAQRQMQTAVDSAALEGLRFRDQVPPGNSGSDPDLARRPSSVSALCAHSCWTCSR